MAERNVTGTHQSTPELIAQLADLDRRQAFGELASLLERLPAVQGLSVEHQAAVAYWRGKVALLKRYGVTMGDEYIELLENAPYDWSNTTKATYSAREQLAPLQALQVLALLQALA